MEAGFAPGRLEPILARVVQLKLGDQISAFAPQDLRPGSEALEQYNVARVKSYLQENLGCMQVEAARALDLDRRTVSKAIKIIRGKL